MLLMKYWVIEYHLQCKGENMKTFKNFLSEGADLYCPNCANKITLDTGEKPFCDMCGLNIQELRKRRSK